MNHTLLETLSLQPGQMVALVGAGGKTTTLQRLVAEIRAAGRTVLTTSTVHMVTLKGGAPHAFLVEPDPARLRAALPGLLAAWGHVRVAGEYLRADKIRGLAPEAVAALRGTPGLDYLLVEADGARHRSFKAPGAHEPVLPPGVDVVLLVVGLDILGKPLSDDTVHRAAEVTALTGLAEGDPITIEAVAAVLTHPTGGLKGVPPTAAVWVVATRFSTALAREAGELGVQLLQADPITGVLFLGPAPVAALAHTPFAHMRADSEQWTVDSEQQ
jgi:probable selenium-dependent hydroxylase accessory protein YqeC